MFHSQGSYPIKIQCTVTTYENLDKEANDYEKAYYNNDPVPDNSYDLVYVPYNQTNEFFERYNQLINEFNMRSTILDNEYHKKNHN